LFVHDLGFSRGIRILGNLHRDMAHGDLIRLSAGMVNGRHPSIDLAASYKGLSPLASVFAASKPKLHRRRRSSLSHDLYAAFRPMTTH
jgi:hypothetical protein